MRPDWRSNYNQGMCPDGIKPTTFFGICNNTPANWATQPGLFWLLFLLFIMFLGYGYRFFDLVLAFFFIVGLGETKLKHMKWKISHHLYGTEQIFT